MEPIRLAAVQLDPASTTPLYRQIYDLVRRDILEGRLAGGQRLAATRDLAEHLAVSRNTVVEAFEQLTAEGYLTGRVGAGTFVAEDLPESLLRAAAPRQASGDAPAPQISARGKGYRAWAGRARVVRARPFQVGRPAVDRFPWATWSRLAARRWRALPRGWLDYGDALGYRPLREALARHLRQTRGFDCDPGRIVIVRGSQQGMDLAARVLLDEGEAAWIEDPGYLGARSALEAAGARLVPVPVDGEGLRVDEGRARAPSARLAYVTPSHQYPLGTTLSLARRLELLAWAREAGAWVVEDDYDSDYRFAGRPLASLAGLDGGRRVLYIGTLSKVLFPALRLGFMVVPPEHLDAFVGARYSADRHTSTLEQAVVADFLDGGHFGRHVRRMRTLYRHRQEVLAAAVTARLGDVIDLPFSPTGLHAVGYLRRRGDDREAARRAAEAGVHVSPLSDYCLERRMAPGLLFGYAGFPDDELTAATDRLATALTGG